MIVFPSAYDGGALINGYAAVHMYHVVTSVWGNGPAACRVINPLGEDECVSTGVDDLAEVTVDLDTGYFHTDHNLPKLGRLRRKLGNRIHIKTCGRQNMISITSDDPEWPMERIIQEFELLTYQGYIAQSTEDNLIHSQQFPEEE